MRDSIIGGSVKNTYLYKGKITYPDSLVEEINFINSKSVKSKRIFLENTNNDVDLNDTVKRRKINQN